jgi:hypothetical protein
MATHACVINTFMIVTITMTKTLLRPFHVSIYIQLQV